MDDEEHDREGEREREFEREGVKVESRSLGPPAPRRPQPFVAWLLM